MPIEVTQAHREQALLACAILPGVEATRWRLEGWYDPILSKIAEAIADAEARGVEAGEKHGRAAGAVDTHCLAELIAASLREESQDCYFTAEYAQDQHPHAWHLVSKLVNLWRRTSAEYRREHVPDAGEGSE
jgi:hypothetical protein